MAAKNAMVHGDDLEDDYIPDTDLIISGEESRGSDEDEEYKFQGNVDSGVTLIDTQGDKLLSKKRKRREKEKEKRAKVCCLCTLTADETPNNILNRNEGS